MKINANGTEISVILSDSNRNGNYISLTDIAKKKNPRDPAGVVANWLRSRNTIDFLGLWESMNNPNFKLLEFEEFRYASGANAFTLSPQQWIKSTNAVGIISKSGRYGGTFAHSDIAFEFASWITPELTQQEKNYQYASEADILNMALFGKTAKQFREETGNKKENMRDYASVEQLIVLVNLESMNAELIREGLSQTDRLQKLRSVAYYQLKSLEKSNAAAKLKRKVQQQIEQK